MNNKKRGFSLVGLLILLAIAAVGLILTASVITRRHLAKDDDVTSGSHGTYVCYRENDGSLWEIVYTDSGSQRSEGCNTLNDIEGNNSYIPKIAKNFSVTLVGGGGGGANSYTSNVTDPNDEMYFIETLAEKKFDFRLNDPGHPKGVDFGLYNILDNSTRNIFDSFIKSMDVDITVGGGGGANAVLNGIRADNNITRADWIEGLFNRVFGTNFDNTQSLGINFCRCSSFFDGNTQNDNLEINTSELDDFNSAINNGGLLSLLKIILNTGIAETKWDWSNYPACYSPQCTRGRSSASPCNAIDDSTNQTYSVAARGGTGGACHKEYRPNPGEHISFQIGKGGVYSDYAPKSSAFEIKDYPSKGGDGFIDIPGHHYKAQGGDAPQYRAVESSGTIYTQSFCPVHASVSSCGKDSGSAKERKCSAKGDRGDGGCLEGGGIIAGTYRRGGAGGFGYSGTDLSKRSSEIPSKQDGFSGQGVVVVKFVNDVSNIFFNLYSKEFTYYGGTDPSTKAPYTSASSNPFAIKAQRVNFIVFEGQAGNAGYYKTNIRRTKLKNTDFSGWRVGRGGDIGTPGEATTALGEVAAGGEAGGIKQRSYIAQTGSTSITVDNYNGQSASGRIHNTPNINDIQTKHSCMLIDGNTGLPTGVDENSSVIGGGGAGGAYLFNGGRVIDNAGTRAALVEYTDSSGTVTVTSQTPIYGATDAPTELSGTQIQAGRGRGGAIIITW